MRKVKREIRMPSKVIVTTMVLMDLSQISVVRTLNNFKGIEMTEDKFHDIMLNGATGQILPYLAQVLELYHYIPEGFQFIEEMPERVKWFSIKETRRRQLYGIAGA